MQASETYPVGLSIAAALLVAGCLTSSPNQPEGTGHQTVRDSVPSTSVSPGPPERPPQSTGGTALRAEQREFNGTVKALYASAAGASYSDAAIEGNENCISVTKLTKGGLASLDVTAYFNASTEDSRSWRLAAHIFYPPPKPEPFDVEAIGTTSPLHFEVNVTGIDPIDDRAHLAIWVFPADSPIGVANSMNVHFVVGALAINPPGLEFMGTKSHRCA